jgi:aryl-alcohol dehydrogenase-like predicted oxidoreductase
VTIGLVPLGRDGLKVGAIGYGAWGLSGDYGAANDEQSAATIRRALELGVTLIDTADEYGNGHNERLVGAAIREWGRREDVVLATKFGIVRQGTASNVCGHPSYVRPALEASLERLGVDHVDLYYLHRQDPAVPVEETVGAMAELVGQGKVRYLGLCEVSADVIRHAHAVHPIAAVQSEYSLWTRDPEKQVLPVARQLGIGFVAFSPLGRGFLTGSLTSREAITPNDFRYSLPRFQPGNFDRNLQLVVHLEELAGRLGASPAQVALAWLLEQGVVPIPGTRSIAHLEKNLDAFTVKLSPRDIEQLDAVFQPDLVAGARYRPDRRF